MFNKSSTVWTAAFLAGVAVIIYNIMPLVLNVAADEMGLVESQLGMLASSWLGGFALALVSATVWVRRFNWRHVVSITSICVAILYLATLYSTGYLSLVAILFVIGCLNGSAFGPIIVVLGETRVPERSFGIMFVMQVSLASLGLFVLPVTVIPLFGFGGVMVCLAALSFLSLGTLRWFPRLGINHGEETQQQESGSSLPCLVGIAAIFLYFVGQSGIWAFLGRIGSNEGLSLPFIGVVLGVAALLGGLGALTAAAIGSRLGRILPMIIGVSGSLMALLMLALHTSSLFYSISAGLFFFSMNLTTPFQMGIVNAADVRRRFVVLIPAAQGIGAAMGPLAAGNLIMFSGFSTIYIMSGLTAVTAVAVLIGIASKMAEAK